MERSDLVARFIDGLCAPVIPCAFLVCAALRCTGIVVSGHLMTVDGYGEFPSYVDWYYHVSPLTRKGPVGP